MANPLARAGAVTGSLMLSSAGPTVSRSTDDGHSDAVRWALRRHSHFINLHDYTVTTLFTHLEVIFAFSSSLSMIRAWLHIFVLKEIPQHSSSNGLKFPRWKKEKKLNVLRLWNIPHTDDNACVFYITLHFCFVLYCKLKAVWVFKPFRKSADSI